MRKVASMLAVAALVMSSIPAAALAQDEPSIAVMGTVYSVQLQPLSNSELQIRNLKTGYRIGSTRSDERGSYAFRGMKPGSYVVEVVNAEGRVLGMSAPFVLSTAPTVNVSVVSVAQGTASAGSGFSLLGMGPVTSLAVIGAASAAAVTAVVATRPDASPSR